MRFSLCRLGIGKICALKKRSPERGVSEIRAAQVCASQVRVIKLGPVKIGISEMGLTQVGAPQRSTGKRDRTAPRHPIAHDLVAAQGLPHGGGTFADPRPKTKGRTDPRARPQFHSFQTTRSKSAQMRWRTSGQIRAASWPRAAVQYRRNQPKKSRSGFSATRKTHRSSSQRPARHPARIRLPRSAFEQRRADCEQGRYVAACCARYLNFAPPAVG